MFCLWTCCDVWRGAQEWFSTPTSPMPRYRGQKASVTELWRSSRSVMCAGFAVPACSGIECLHIGAGGESGRLCSLCTGGLCSGISHKSTWLPGARSQRPGLQPGSHLHGYVLRSTHTCPFSLLLLHYQRNHRKTRNYSIQSYSTSKLGAYITHNATPSLNVWSHVCALC